MSAVSRSIQIWWSLRSLPLWVQIWVQAILFPANAAAFFLLHTWLGAATAIAALFVLLTNVPLMYWAGGMTRLLSVPHLIAWIPLQVAIVMRLAAMVGNAPPSRSEIVLGSLLFVVNGISLVFDTIDSWRWLRGEREVAGRQ